MNHAMIVSIKRQTKLILLLFAFGSGCVENSPDCSEEPPVRVINGFPPSTETQDLEASVIRILLKNEIGGYEIESFCTGVAVTAKHVLTAAHCFEEKNDWRLEIYTKDSIHKDIDLHGTNDICRHIERSEARLIGINTTLDAALIESDEASLTPAKIGISPTTGKKAILGGYGLNSDGKVGILSFLMTTVISVTNDRITVDSGAEAGACVGDSGGPLFQFDETGKERQLIGILSGGSVLCRGEDIFTNIIPVQKWWFSVIEDDRM